MQPRPHLHVPLHPDANVTHLRTSGGLRGTEVSMTPPRRTGSRRVSEMKVKKVELNRKRSFYSISSCNKEDQMDF